MSSQNPENESMSERTGDRFTDFLKRLVRVPKREIDEQERRDTRNKERRKHPRPAKPGQIVPSPNESR
jgi:hypothetical protein